MGGYQDSRYTRSTTNLDHQNEVIKQLLQILGEITE